jgi:hypothetical protein
MVVTVHRPLFCVGSMHLWKMAFMVPRYILGFIVAR